MVDPFASDDAPIAVETKSIATPAPPIVPPDAVSNYSMRSKKVNAIVTLAGEQQ